MHSGGVENGHAYQDLLLACEVRRRCGTAAQPESTIPDLAKLYHNSPRYLHGYQHKRLEVLEFHLT